MMIPITRKEKYINEIVGGGNTAPETPQTREELFFADILGEVVAPSPITRAEKYLAKIANKYNGELPEPVTRIERFLARAAGMNVSIPTPVTREEMLWANYALIVEKELSGIPPLTFNAIAGTLSNYRIYGNTVSGESVGDRTGNLFNLESITLKKSLGYDGSIYTAQSSNLSAYIQILSDNCVLSYNYTTLASSSKRNICFYNSKKQCIGYMQYLPTDLSILISLPENCKYIRITLDENIYNVMLNSGSTALPYEPYGYRVPVTVTNGTDTQTTNIYLPEPLTKSGDNADYTDFVTQKQYYIDGTSANVTLPALPTLPGTNTLSVGTEVQPSNVYIKYEGAQ